MSSSSPGSAQINRRIGLQATRMDAGGAQKRKAAASTSLHKKPRRSGRDKSEFVSVEVGMREFKKRLAASGAGDAAASSTNAVEDLTQDVKAAKARAKPKAEAKAVATTTIAAAVRKTQAPRATVRKAKRPAGETKKVTKAPVKKTPAAARKSTPAKKPTAPRTTRAASKMTLAEVKAQLEREQKERVEYCIQTLHREAKPTAATSSSAPATAVTTASAPEIAVHISAAPSTAAPAVVTPAASPVHREVMLVAGAVPRQNIGGPPVLEAAAVPNSAASVAFEKHVLGTQAYTPTAPPTAPIPFSAAPASSSAPLSSPAKNEFIVDDMDEDLMFAMALEEVELKLATPQKLPPSREAVAATSDPFSLVSAQAEIQSTQNLTTQAQLTEAVVETKQARSPLVVAPEVLGEMDRLRRENELLRRSNELLQAAVASPAQAEACAPADEQLGRFPVDSTARDCKKKSAASPKDTLPDTSVVKSTARYLDLTRCDSDHDMKQKISALEGGQIRERTPERHSTESQRANSDRQAQDILEEGSVLTNKKEKAHDDQQKCEADKGPAAEQEILAEHASELSSTATTQEPAPSTPLSGHFTPGDKDHPSPTHPIVTEQEPDHENGVAPPEKAQPMLHSPKESVDKHYVNTTTGSDDGDVSDANMSEADEEEETMDEDDPAPRTSTIDSGNYTEYKVHQEVNFEADEDGLLEEGSLESKTAVSNEKVDPALTVSTPVDSNPCETLVISEPDANQQPGTPTNSEILERTIAPSNTDEEEEEGDDEDEVMDRVKRREVIALSSSSSSSESESEDDEASDIPSSNVLEAALRAAGGDSGQKNRTKPISTANGAVIKGEIAGGLQEPKSASAVAASTSPPSVPVKSASKKRKTPGFSSANGKKPPSVKSSLLWPALDEFYDFLLDLSPRNVHESEKKRVHLQKYSGEKLPAHHSCIEDYCNVQLEAIMEELVASVSNSTDRRGGGGSGPTRQLSLASVSPCGMQGMSTPSVGLSLGAIFSESGFTGNTCNNNDYILTFDASALGKKASSDFFSGDLVLLRSPRWKNYEMCAFGVVLCDSTVAVGGKSGPGGKGSDGSGESDQICVLIRAQQRDREDAVENFSVLTELCLSNQRASNWRWSMQQVHNTTTSAREFQAIKAISFFHTDLKQVLLRGQLVPSAKTEETLKKSAASSSILSPRLLKYLHKNYNDSQVQAILGCLGEDSRVIIQGPPGTGKTKTILGLLSALLDGAGLSTFQKTRGTARIRVGASLQSARTSAVSKTVAETSIRVLVAAPSNAAVDELVVRVLSEGLFDGEKGESYRPRIVRVGRPESSHQQSSLAAAREASESKKNRKKMRKYAREVEEVLLESLVTKHRSTFPTVKQARQAIIKNAQIVFCTLSGAGSVAMCEFAQDFDALIVDEAAQAVEASTLIPFKFRPQRVVLVGDHRQLPATVISKKLVSMGYDRSLQQRLVENGSPVLLLNQQYRMHPEIAEFPSGHFYGGRLVQDDNMREWTAQDYHRDRAFKPLLFLDVQGAQSQVSRSTSLRNMSEVETVVQLVRRLLTKFPRIEWKKRIGVIAPYKQQIYEVRGAIGKLEAEFDRHLDIEVNTVDGFQGREKEIIIYSCVRTSHGGRRKKKRWSHGNEEEDNVLDAFWADERRMNVAITRAKSSLWIVGNSTLLKRSRVWRALIQHTKNHNRYIGDGATTLFASGSSTRKVSKALSKPGK